jgi:aryl-alcohol dehydrogenase-like predicted oxidoreductase
MEQREIARLGRSVSVVGLGTWQLGADTVIPGASSVDQVAQNASVAELAPLREDQLAGARCL